jgi:hypothetical protein
LRKCDKILGPFGIPVAVKEFPNSSPHEPSHVAYEENVIEILNLPAQRASAI